MSVQPDPKTPVTLFIYVQECSTLHCMFELLESEHPIRLLHYDADSIADDLSYLGAGETPHKELFRWQDVRVMSEAAIKELNAPDLSSYVRTIVLDIVRDGWFLTFDSDSENRELYVSAIEALFAAGRSIRGPYRTSMLVVLSPPLPVNESTNRSVLGDLLNRLNRPEESSDPLFPHIAIVEIAHAHAVNSIYHSPPAQPLENIYLSANTHSTTLFIGLVDPCIPYCIAEMIKQGHHAHVMADDSTKLEAKLFELKVQRESFEKYVTFDRRENKNYKEMARRLKSRAKADSLITTIVFTRTADDTHRPESSEDERKVFAHGIEHAFLGGFGTKPDRTRSLHREKERCGPTIIILSLAPHYLGDQFIDHHTLSCWASQRWQSEPESGPRDLGKGPYPETIIARPLYNTDGEFMPKDLLNIQESASKLKERWTKPQSVAKWLFACVSNTSSRTDLQDNSAFSTLLSSEEMVALRKPFPPPFAKFRPGPAHQRKKKKLKSVTTDYQDSE